MDDSVFLDQRGTVPNWTICSSRTSFFPTYRSIKPPVGLWWRKRMGRFVGQKNKLEKIEIERNVSKASLAE